MYKLIALVPSPIYKTPPQDDNGDVPQVRADALVVVVIEHGAIADSGLSTIIVALLAVTTSSVAVGIISPTQELVAFQFSPVRVLVIVAPKMKF